MSTKIEGRTSSYDLIDDIVETSSSLSNRKSLALIDGTKILSNRNHSSYSNLPSLFNKTKFEQIDNSTISLTNEVRDRLHLSLPRSNSSLILMSNDDRRKELDLIIKSLYDGKLLTTNNDDRPSSEVSEQSFYMLSKGPLTTTTSKNREESKHHMDLLPLDGDITSLQRELQEKELDIVHLHKEIQELQLENKLLKSKAPTVYSNGYSNNHHEIDSVRREKDIIHNELRTSQELIAKFQHQQHQNVVSARSNKIDEIVLHQKEALEHKLKNYEKQMRTLTHENDKLKQNSHQTERLIAQFKRDKEELQQKITEAKKRNDELFYQEFNTLRNDLKMLKQKNNELFEENLRLQHAWRSSNHDQTSSKQPNSDPKHLKIPRSDSPNLSEASDSTNYLTSVSVDRYHTRPSTSVHRSLTIDGNNHHRTSRYNSFLSQDDIYRNNPLSKSLDQHLNLRSSKPKRNIEWNEDNIQINDNDDDYQTADDSKFYQTNHRSQVQHHSRRTMSSDTSIQQDDRRPTRRNPEAISARRPYAPLSINDVRLNDLIKFSRPGGKISKGTVKYIGTIPGKTDQYLGLELEDEDSKHDGVYQDQRLFQCKPNKGVFVAFNKVIMAWGGK